jgi:four helix bundle protein
MNDPEVTMSDNPTNSNLIATRKALKAATIALSIARGVPAPLKSLADQVIRSATSVPANLEEGHGRTGRDRSQHWRYAYASAREVDVHLRLLAESDAVDRRQAEKSIKLFDEVRAMTWRLLHPRR